MLHVQQFVLQFELPFLYPACKRGGKIRIKECRKGCLTVCVSMEKSVEVLRGAQAQSYHLRKREQYETQSRGLI